ncbi:MAG TPA: GTP-binding protein, partial [Lacipirellulaceae bacterium]|nr:GTP-binding protein [Lacipirellulaceae bacterium]
MTRNVADIRNIVFCGHGHAGKTTLVDHLLVAADAVKGNPSVDAGTSVCDFDEEEKQHKYSIEASLVHFDHAGKRFNVIDAPGYPDLVGQMIGALRAVETAVIAIDAHSGIKVNTRRAWAEAAKAGCGRMIVLTKLDSDNIDLPGLVESIRESFGPGCVLLNVPLGLGESLTGVASTLHPPADANGAVIDPKSISEALVESIIEVDEAVMERYFEGELPSDAELSRLMVQAIAAGSLTPIVCTSVKKGVGVKELMDILAAAALPPTAVARQGTKDGDKVTLKCDPTAPLAAQGFKT